MLDAHLRFEWAAHAVRAPGLLAAVQETIGEAVAVENTFLLIKWPGREFRVPWHQDGTNRRMQLDPARSVAAWLAITDATSANGCLQVIPGSHTSGYLGNDRETSSARRGRTLGVQGMPNGPHDHGLWLPLDAGQACLMDVRLLHRSDSNTTAGARIGRPGAHRRGRRPRSARQQERRGVQRLPVLLPRRGHRRAVHRAPARQRRAAALAPR
ncbi:phytanoyl-CoA dioxygenase family protein [Streptomyces sp. NPDC006430]|uniref:phytanoyl-CoA dioxygenase family protein n=1 Tax=Streptomyces sp. NPDC006430 TaxID=3154299 RepID=UPI0033AD4F7B